MSFLGTLGRIGAGVATLGGTEILGVGDQIQDGTLFDPSKDERARAEAMQQQAVQAWKDAQGRIPSAASITPQAYSMGGMAMGAQADYSGPGQTAYQDNPAMRGAASYFQSLQNNPIDSIAQAQYAQAVQNAENARRSQASAANSAAEARGQGNAGARALGEVAANQGMATDMYQGGMQAAGMAAQRRDAAAQAGYGIAQNTANAQDQFALERSRGQSANNEANAQRMQGAFDSNTGRERQVADANTSANNDAMYFNNVTSPQQYWQNYLQTVQGQTGQLGSAANTQLTAGQMQPDWGGRLLTAGSNVATAAGMGRGK